jgi:hypothetical protein
METLRNGRPKNKYVLALLMLQGDTSQEHSCMLGAGCIRNFYKVFDFQTNFARFLYEDF